MKKMTKGGKMVPMTKKEKAIFIVSMIIACVLDGIVLYKLYCLFF